jgi:hypothetical protein
MVIPTYINAIFKDENFDCAKVKLETKPFVSGSIDSVINWMVSNPIGNVDMEDIKSHETFFFLACKHNPSDELITWLVETGETNLNFVNSQGENILEYLGKSAFNSPQISSRIKLLLNLGWEKFDLNKPNKFSDSVFDIFCYSGYTDVINYCFLKGFEPSQERIARLIQKINNIITGECDDYWSTDEVNEEFLFQTLEQVLNLLEQNKIC